MSPTHGGPDLRRQHARGPNVRLKKLIPGVVRKGLKHLSTFRFRQTGSSAASGLPTNVGPLRVLSVMPPIFLSGIAYEM
jgi:hypothetical protein